MSKENKVLLLYPPNQLYDTEAARSDGSLGLPYLAASLEREGIKADILDASVGIEGYDLKDTFNRRVKQRNGLTRIGMNFDEIAQHVVENGYDVVGINSNFTPQTRMVFETAAAIRDVAPDVLIYSGGVNGRALKERFLGTGNFDGICLTEGELIFPKVVKAGTNGASLYEVPGMAFALPNGEIRVNPADPTCFPNDNNLDELPMPAWEKLPLERYDEIGIGAAHGFDVTGEALKRNGSLMTSRGCPFRCAYCHISVEKENPESGGIGNYRMHSMGRVLEEIDRLQELGVGKLYFEDDSLLADKDRVKNIFRNVSGRGLSIMDVNGVNLVHLFDRKKPKIEGFYQVDHEYLEILKDGGFSQIVFPLESGSTRVQKKYATNKVLLDRMNLVDLMKAMTAIGIKAPVNTMVGFPDETEDEMMMSIDLSKKLREEGGAPYIDIFFPIPFPGSNLYTWAIKGGHLDPGFDTDDMNWKNPVMKNTAVHPNRIEEIVKKAIADVNSPEYLKSRKAAHIDHK